MSDQIVSAPTRRALFAGAGAVGAAAVLAACGDDSDPAVSPTATEGGDPAGTVLGKKADIPVGGGKIFAEQGVVVTQPTEGQFVGFSSICTHQQCPLSSVADGKINCSCHFSEFSITDGSVLSPPATTALPKKEIVVNGDDISLA